ncbi:MAG: CoA-disulfide reductase [Firmicutes bacterium HGW-Firmicutes-15]|nr:MAG: CoA-disulfide reductase [Firmicutes bacterium HGW-Firmicutes-15]
MGKKIIIVGGVAAGASTAARLRRMDEEAEIIMVERGEYISFANCGLPYYVGGVIEQRKRLLVQTPTSMHRRFNIDVKTNSEVQRIIPDEKVVIINNTLSDQSYRESYDYLVLCPGASPIIPDIPGVHQPNVFTVRNVPDSDVIKQHIEVKRPAAAVILGGGFIGLEMAEMLNKRDIKVTLVEASNQLIGVLDSEMAAIVHNYLQNQGIELCLSDRAVSFEGSSSVETVILDSGKSIQTDMVVLGIGVKPEAWLAAEAGLAIGSTGGILVDEYLRTSDPYIYAAGDAIQVKDFITGQDILLPLASPANRQGWLIANNLCGRPSKYSGAQGTAIVKIMDMTVAVTGKNEKALRKLGWVYQTCHAQPNSHATYYPGATQMMAKLIFSPEDGKVFGAQIVGWDGVDKRIDVLATAIRAGMTVFDLQELELAYAPPFSSAKDPVNMLAYAASNVVLKDIEIVHWPEVPEHLAQGAFLIDARTPQEFKHGAAYSAYNIPVDEIRDRLDEIPQDQEILVYCGQGLRSYIVNRILRQKGYNAKNISGGYELYKYQL